MGMPRGIVDTERYAFAVRRELESCLIGRLPDWSSTSPVRLTHTSCVGTWEAAQYDRTPVSATEKLALAVFRVLEDVLRQDGGVAGGLRPVQVEGQGQQRALAREQKKHGFPPRRDVRVQLV